SNADRSRPWSASPPTTPTAAASADCAASGVGALASGACCTWPPGARSAPNRPCSSAIRHSEAGANAPRWPWSPACAPSWHRSTPCSGTKSPGTLSPSEEDSCSCSRSPASAQQLCAPPRFAGRQHHRLQHLAGFDADEARVLTRGEVGDAGGEAFAGVPDDRIAEALVFDLEAMFAVDQGERGDDVAVDAVGFAVEGDCVIVLAVQGAAVGAVLVVAALQAFDRDAGEVVHTQVGVQGGGKVEGGIAAVLHLQGDAQPRAGQRDRQAAGEGMRPVGATGAVAQFEMR